MVYYLKVNREKEYTVTNLKHWIEAADVEKGNRIYILCDNDNLRKTILSEIKLDDHVQFLESIYDNDDIRDIVDNTTLGTWKKIAYAHLTTFFHAEEHGYESFWNIDADDTFLCLDAIRLSELLGRVENNCRDGDIHLTNLDMWHSISDYEQWSDITHWSFGVSYTDNTVNWTSLLKKHMNDEAYHKMRKLHSNLDWFFTYLSANSGLRINSFYAENLKFIHYFSNFIDYPHKGTVYHYKEGKIVFPILKYCFGLEEMGEISIMSDDMKVDMNLLDSEATIALIGNSKEKEVFAKELKKIRTTDPAAKKRLEKYKKQYGYETIVLYGAGDYLYRNYEILREAGAVECICDSDSKKWGKEILDGIMCIRPEELKEKRNCVVVIAVEQVTTAFEIARFLLGMGVNQIDHIDNLKRVLQGV